MSQATLLRPALLRMTQPTTTTTPSTITVDPLRARTIPRRIGEPLPDADQETGRALVKEYGLTVAARLYGIPRTSLATALAGGDLQRATREDIARRIRSYPASR